MHGNTINSTSINSESTRVREIYPQYLRDTATNVISFLEEYYDYMNRVGYPSYEVDHVVSENDIDQTSEKYLDAIQGEIAKIVPNSAVVDRNTLYKRIVHYYKLKGTPDSIDVFFKIFFDSLAELYYPNKDLFKLSEGDFAQEIKYFIDSNVKYNADNSLELLTPNELSIVPSNQPVLGDDFIISFTALLNNDQLNDDAYVFTTTDYLPTLDEPGLFDLRRDTSGTYLAIQQSGYVGGATTLRFDSDIFNDEWTNVRIEYSANADDITITETDATHVTVDGAGAYTNLNGSYTKSNGTLWENGTADYSAAEVTAFIEYPISELIDGQKYKITSAGTTDFTALGATDSNVGTIFTYNNITSEDATTGKVKHRLPVWHLIDNGTIRYIDANAGSYHVGGAVAGSNRVPVSSAAAISSISFIDYSTLQSVQTAKVKAYSNGNTVLSETIKHNRGYFNATENFSIFSKNTSVANTFDCRGRLAAFRIEGALSNNFDYRFTSLDAASNNALRDWSGSGNDGSILVPGPDNWSWNNDQSSYGPLPTSIHPLPEVTSYQDRGGFPSSEKKIQDSKFWQDYSYQISTKVAPELWRESYSRLVHPAGMKFFVLLLIEIVNRSTWTELLSYTSSSENPESWYNALVPPAKRLQDPSEGYHTPRYQPGWLNSAQIAIVLAIAELQYASAAVDPYVNNFVETANSSSITRMNNFSNRSREGFTSAHNVAHTIFGVAGFPLTRILKEGERIRFKFNYTTGANSTPTVTLLKNRNSANASGVIATLGNGVEIINDVAQAGAGHTLSANQTRVSVDITLESQDDCVQFIAFIDGADTSGKSLSVDGFEIVDVDRSDYPLVVGGDSLSVIASANARYNRNQNFERSVVFDSVIAITPFNYRSKYIHDELCRWGAGFAQSYLLV